MIKPPSLQSTYTLVWSGDPALDLPEAPPDATDEQRAKIDSERTRLLRIARQTGNWPIRAGEQPTAFTFRNLSHNEFAWVQGESNRRQLGASEINNLFFLIAITGIANFGDIKVHRSRVASVEGSKESIWLANGDVLDKLHVALANVEDGAAMLVNECVGEIVRRARGIPDPL